MEGNLLLGWLVGHGRNEPVWHARVFAEERAGC